MFQCSMLFFFYCWCCLTISRISTSTQVWLYEQQYMYACMYVCMYACMHVCMYACMHVCMYACMHVCMYACMYVCMYVCMSSSSSSSPLYCLRENIYFDTLIRRSSRGHNSRKATQPSHCGTCLLLLIFIAKRVQPSLPSSTLRSNFVYPRQISRSPRVGHCMS